MTRARQNADNVAGDISGVTAGTGLTGGGTSGTVTLTNDMATTIAAAGDLIYGTGNDAYTRLGLGTASQYLAVNSGATAPEWVTLNAGGMTLISETIASGASSLSFSSISGSYKQLFMVWSGIQNTSTATNFFIRLNNDSGSNYALFYQRAIGSSYNNGSQNTTAISNLGWNQNGTSASLENQSVGSLIIDNYASTTKAKYYQYLNNYERSSDSSKMSEWTAGTYNSTSAITSIDIVRTSGSGTFSNTGNTTIRLYGVS